MLGKCGARSFPIRLLGTYPYRRPGSRTQSALRLGISQIIFDSFKIRIDLLLTPLKAL